MKKRTSKIDKFRKIIGYSFIVFFICFFLRIAIGNYLLEKIGICKKSVLTNEVIQFSTHPDALIYNFWINGKKYDGNSNIEDLSKVGDSICIVYLELMPYINKPVSYFNNINCKCE